MVAPASRGSPGESFPSAASSACTSGSPPSRENPRDSSAPSASTMTAPTEKAVSDGGHCHASETASRIHRSSSAHTCELYRATPRSPSVEEEGEPRDADGGNGDDREEDGEPTAGLTLQRCGQRPARGGRLLRRSSQDQRGGRRLGLPGLALLPQPTVPRLLVRHCDPRPDGASAPVPLKC